MARHTPFSIAAGLGVAAFHTGITLWYRLPILMAAGAMTPKDAAELDRMVSEKVKAATLGMIDGQKELMRLSAAAMTGRPKLDGGSAVAEAALRPALRTVKRNASRLRRRKPRTRRKG
jgi:hypothetical protein